MPKLAMPPPGWARLYLAGTCSAVLSRSCLSTSIECSQEECTVCPYKRCMNLRWYCCVRDRDCGRSLLCKFVVCSQFIASNDNNWKGTICTGNPGCQRIRIASPHVHFDVRQPLRYWFTWRSLHRCGPSGWSQNWVWQAWERSCETTIRRWREIQKDFLS